MQNPHHLEHLPFGTEWELLSSFCVQMTTPGWVAGASEQGDMSMELSLGHSDPERELANCLATN